MYCMQKPKVIKLYHASNDSQTYCIHKLYLQTGFCFNAVHVNNPSDGSLRGLLTQPGKTSLGDV